MAKKSSSILDGLEDAIAYAQGGKGRGKSSTVTVPDHVDVKAIRLRQRLSQGDFARQFGFPISSVQNWEQGRREPAGAARLLLTIIDLEPRAVQRALANCNRVHALAGKKSSYR